MKRRQDMSVDFFSIDRWVMERDDIKTIVPDEAAGFEQQLQAWTWTRSTTAWCRPPPSDGRHLFSRYLTAQPGLVVRDEQNQKQNISITEMQ